MNTISDNERAEAQAMSEAFLGRGELAALSDSGVRRWLAVRDHVLAAHECPSTNRRALGHYRHPRMDGQTECPECGYLMHEHGWLDTGGDGIVVCPSLHGPFGGQAVTDHARNHTCPTVPVWRPTTADEIQAGWEVRSRRPDGSEAGWGIAHHRDEDGDWRTEADTILTFATLRWASETTAPAPEPEPVDDDLLEALMGKVLPPEQNASPTKRKVINMNNLSDEQCARALELRNIWANVIPEAGEARILDHTHSRAWLAVEKHVLESRKSEWRLVTRDEIQEGWEVRTCDPYGTEATWGIAHHQDNRGDWFTEACARLTYNAPSWIYETTAPKPKPDPRIEVLAKELHEESGCEEPWPCSTATDHYRKRARKLLASFNDLMEQPSAPSPQMTT